jgi:hypothetical protein
MFWCCQLCLCQADEAWADTRRASSLVLSVLKPKQDKVIL